MLVFDMTTLLKENTKQTAIENLKFWYNSILLHAPNSQIIIVGTCKDIVDGKEDLETIDDILSEHVLDGSP